MFLTCYEWIFKGVCVWSTPLQFWLVSIYWFHGSLLPSILVSFCFDVLIPWIHALFSCRSYVLWSWQPGLIRWWSRPLTPLWCWCITASLAYDNIVSVPCLWRADGHVRHIAVADRWAYGNGEDILLLLCTGTLLQICLAPKRYNCLVLLRSS